MSTLGPYDYWAIEYGYKQVDAAQEAAELERIASRSNEPDARLRHRRGRRVFAVDPAVNQGDLSSDPLDFAKKRLALVRELWERSEKRELKPGESYSVLRRNFTRGLNEVGQASGVRRRATSAA